MAGRNETIQFSLLAKDLASRQFKNASGSLKGLGDHAGRVQGPLSKMGSIAGSAFKAIGRAAVTGLKVATAALVGFVGYSVKKAADFEKAMTESLAIMGDVSGPMSQQMEDAARSVGRTTKFSAEDAAKSYFYLASAGMDAASSIEALPKVAAFAQAGNFDMALATDLLTDAQSALGLSIRDDVVKNMENMARVSDVLVKANTLANATVQQFSESLTNRAGAALKLVNKDIEEGVAVLAAWADQGVKGAEAGTRMDIVIRDLQKVGIKSADAMKEFGIEIFDSSGNMHNMADIVGDLENALSGMSDEQKRGAVMQMGFQDRSVSAMLSLLGTSDAIRQYEEDLRSAGGITEEVAGKQLQSLSAQLGLLKGAVDDVAIGLGTALIPLITPIVQGISEWMGANQKLIEQIAGVLVEGIVSFVSMAAEGFGRVVDFVSRNWPTISAVMQGVAEIARAAIDRIIEAAEWLRANVLPTLLEAFNGIRDWFAANAGKIGEMFGSMWNAGKAALVTLAPLLGSLGRVLLPVLGGALERVIPRMTAFFDKVTLGIERLQGFRAAATEMRDKVHAALGGMWVQFQVIGLNIAAWASEKVADLRGMVAGILEAMGRIPGPIGDAARESAAHLRGLQSEAMDTAAEFRMQAKTIEREWNVDEAIERGAREASEATRFMASEVNRHLSGLSAKAYTYGSNITSSLTSGLNQGYGMVRDAAGRLGAAVRGQIGIDSEPSDPRSPLRGITKWGLNIAGELTRMVEGTGAVTSAARRLAGAAGEAGDVSLPPMASAAYGTGGYGGGASVTINFNSAFPMSPAQAQEVARSAIPEFIREMDRQRLR